MRKISVFRVRRDELPSGPPRGHGCPLETVLGSCVALKVIDSQVAAYPNVRQSGGFLPLAQNHFTILTVAQLIVKMPGFEKKLDSSAAALAFQGFRLIARASFLLDRLLLSAGTAILFPSCLFGGVLVST
jgi:hypothetical protein